MFASAVDFTQIPPLDADELSEIGGDTPEWKFNIALSLFGEKERLTFYRAFSVYLKQNIREDDALANWWNVITKRGSKTIPTPLAIMIPVLLYRMNTDGTPWSRSIIPALPANDAMVFRAAQKTGITHEILRRLIDISVLSRTRNKEIRKALAPAAFNIGMIVIVLLGVGWFYIPALKKLLPNLKITGNLARLADVSAFLSTWGIPVICGIILFPYLFKKFLESSSQIRGFFDPMIGFRLYREFTGITYLLGVGEVLRTGGTFEDANRLLLDDATPYVRERIMTVMLHDDMRPADALIASGYNWPNEESLELLQLYMSADNPNEGLDILVSEWFENAEERYVAIGKWVSSICQFATWGVTIWLYIVSSNLVTGTAFLHNTNH